MQRGEPLESHQQLVRLGGCDCRLLSGEGLLLRHRLLRSSVRHRLLRSGLLGSGLGCCFRAPRPLTACTVAAATAVWAAVRVRFRVRRKAIVCS